MSTGVATLTMSQAKGTNHTAATTVVVLTVGRGTPAFGDFVVANSNRRDVVGEAGNIDWSFLLVAGQGSNLTIGV